MGNRFENSLLQEEAEVTLKSTAMLASQRGGFR